MKKLIQSRKLATISISILLATGFSGCGSTYENSNDTFPESSSEGSSTTAGLTAIQYNFGIACDRIRAGVYEGTADLFREAGTMGEEDGDLELAMIAYQYADSLDNYNQNETFAECQNY
jgi:hypothetical protein